MLKKFIASGHTDLNDTINRMSEDSLVVAIEGYPEFEATGEWTIGGSIIEEIYNEYLKDEGMPYAIGIYYVHSLICKRAAHLWAKTKK